MIPTEIMIDGIVYSLIKKEIINSINSETMTFDFGDGLGPVPAHQHKNPDGSLGGWVAETAWVGKTAYVEENARIFGQAVIYGQVQISNNVHINKKMCINHTTKIESQNDIIYGEMKWGDKLLSYTIYQDVENVIWIWFGGCSKSLEEWKSCKPSFPIYQQFVKFLDSVN